MNCLGKYLAKVLRVTLLLCGLALVALACGWFGPVNSVRFNSYVQGHDF